MRIRSKSGVRVDVLAVVLCVVAVVSACLVFRDVQTANRAADAFIKDNPAGYNEWILNYPFARTYTVSAVGYASSCSILAGEVVELKAGARDGAGDTSILHVCFTGLWWKRSLPRVDITNVTSGFGFMPPRSFP